MKQFFAFKCKFLCFSMVVPNTLPFVSFKFPSEGNALMVT
jgi:hypothetical protein